MLNCKTLNSMGVSPDGKSQPARHGAPVRSQDPTPRHGRVGHAEWLGQGVASLPPTSYARTMLLPCSSWCSHVLRGAHFAELLGEAASEGFGRVDVVVCNAGTGGRPLGVSRSAGVFQQGFLHNITFRMDKCPVLGSPFWRRHRLAGKYKSGCVLEGDHGNEVSFHEDSFAAHGYPVEGKIDHRPAFVRRKASRNSLTDSRSSLLSDWETLSGASIGNALFSHPN